MAQQRTAANSLADPPQRGTLSLAYRRSVVALQNVFGMNPASSHPLSQEERERQPLLRDAGAGGYGATSEQNPSDWQSRVRKPKQVISPLRVEAKVWFANEVRSFFSPFLLLSDQQDVQLCCLYSLFS